MLGLDPMTDRADTDELDYYLTKGPILELFDRASEAFLALPEEEAQQLLDSIAEAPNFRGLVAQRVGLSEKQSEYLREKWFGRHWPEQPVEEIFREAAIQAGRLIRAHRLPASTYRCAGAPRFGIAVACASKQITIVVHTPERPSLAEDLGTRGLLDPDIVLVTSDEDGKIVSGPVAFPD